jgi:exo-beta-1,3-glucanase (GH17 family)
MIPLGAVAGLQVIPGAFISGVYPSASSMEVSCLIQTINTYNSSYSFPFAVVGSEVVSQQGIQVNQLTTFITQVRSATGNSVPIATAEFWQTWLSNPSLTAAVDVILVNAYPYYECGSSNPPPLSVCTTIEGAVDYVIQKVRQVQAAYPGKTVLIGETGWPSDGERMGQALASLANEEAYATGILERAAAFGIGLLYFEAFDEAWKIGYGINQGHFGLLTSQRNGNSGVAKGPVENTFLFATLRSTKKDFDDDGKSDILWQNTNGEAYIWEMNGTSAILRVSLGNPGATWHTIASGDFNGDGYADILWQNDSGEAYIWEMNGTNVIGGGSLGNPGPSWHAIASGDFNGDGYSDILWQNASGEVYIWEMNGTTIIGGGSLG